MYNFIKISVFRNLMEITLRIFMKSGGMISSCFRNIMGLFNGCSQTLLHHDSIKSHQLWQMKSRKYSGLTSKSPKIMSVHIKWFFNSMVWNWRAKWVVKLRGHDNLILKRDIKQPYWHRFIIIWELPEFWAASRWLASADMLKSSVSFFINKSMAKMYLYSLF